MAQFLQVPEKDKVSRLQDLSRAEVTDLVDERKAFSQDKIVMVTCKNCDKFITSTVRVRFSLQIILVRIGICLLLICLGLHRVKVFISSLKQ
jgi:hypothetical protein